MTDDEIQAKKDDIERRLLAISAEIWAFVGERRFDEFCADHFTAILQAASAFGGLDDKDEHEEPAVAKAVHRGKHWEVEG